METVEVVEQFFKNYSAALGGWCLIIAYVPQILKTLRTKSVDDMTLSFWLLVTMGVGLFWINATFLVVDGMGTWGYWFAESANLIISAIMLGLFIRYRYFYNKKQGGDFMQQRPSKIRSLDACGAWEIAEMGSGPAKKYNKRAIRRKRRVLEKKHARYEIEDRSGTNE